MFFLDEEKVIEECKSLIFESANEEWLDFITQNRLRKSEYEYNYVEGEVADSRVFQVIYSILNGSIDEDLGIQQLRFKYPTNQILLRNIALASLTFLRYYEVE